MLLQDLSSKDTRVYLDIEGIPATRSYYLIGLLVSRSGAIEERSFWADTEHEEVKIFIELLDYLKQYQNALYTIMGLTRF